jgi:drug/metabolite transporter (DMT)-like permease
MPIAAIGLLLLSAVLHASWNLLLKGAGDKVLATFWTSVLGALIFAPALLFTGLPPREVWGLLLLSSAIEVAYLLTLSHAYRDHEFSLVYPIARGTAPALLAVWSMLLLRESPSGPGLAGLAMIVLGLMVIGGSNFLRDGYRKPAATAVRLALLTALFISLYSLIDGYAVRRAPAVPYAISIFVLIPTLASPLIVSRYGRQAFSAELATHWRRLTAISVLCVLSYMAALLAYSFAPLSYSGAIREVSVVLGAFAGWRFLNEAMGGIRLLGAAVIFAGIVTIAMFG